MRHAVEWKRLLVLVALVAAALAISPGTASAVGLGELFVADGVTYRVTSADTAIVGNGTSPAVPVSATSVTIPSSVETEGVSYAVTAIDACAFENRSTLTAIDLPESLVSIGGSAFRGCSSLTSLTIPTSVTSIGASALSYCQALTSIDIPASVTLVDYGLFSNCSALTTVTIPPSVTSIGDYAFAQCSSLASINIPASVTSIGDSAFMSCRSLASISIPASVTSIGDLAFDGCTTLASANIPVGVTAVGRGTFHGCASLVSVSIPDSVTSIGDIAFMGCTSLTSVVIPGSVSTIGDRAFFGCVSLATAILDPNTPSFGLAVFPPATRILTNLTSATVTGISASYTYAGAPVTPVPVVTLGGRTLASNDYSVSYANNGAVGTGTLVITGKNAYAGVLTRSFGIDKPSLSGAYVTGLSVSYAYTGSAVKPLPTVVLAGKTLTANDYTLTYANNRAVGTGTIIITGKNDYEGQVTRPFAIRKTAVLSRTTSWSTLTRTRTYYAKGYISPRHAASDTNRIKIYAYKLGADGKYRYVKSFPASFSFYSSAKTRYKAAVRLTSRGKWKLVAYHAADSKNAKSTGSADFVTVK